MSKKLHFIISVFFVISLFFNANANVVYVNGSASGANDGSSWTNAYTDLQAALSSSVAGDSILVAKGEYKPHATDSTVAFVLKDSVEIYGGFVGDEASFTAEVFSARDFYANASVLTGDLNDNGVSLTNTQGNTYNVVYALSVDSSAVLDGFTITGGCARDGYPEYYGGGVHLNSSDPVLRNLAIIGNYSDYWGGGLYCSASSPTLINVTITGNECDGYGGGIYCQSASFPVCVNLLCWGNIGSYDPYKNIYNSVSTPNISYSLMEGSGGSVAWNLNMGTDGGNNIASTPCFYNETEIDVRVYSVSPIIEAGDTAYSPNIGQYQESGKAPPAPYYVKSDATGSSDGSSWANAFTDIIVAIDNAIDYQSIYVAAGTYKPHASVRDSSFRLKDKVYIYGGFAGSESSIDQSVIDARDYFHNETILSGDLNGDDSTDFSNMTENSYHVVSVGGTGLSATLDGFTISGGYADENNDGGGAIYFDNGDATIRNLKIYNNYGYYWGGAVYATYSDALLYNVTFVNNYSHYYGAAICNYWDGNLILINVLDSGNVSRYSVNSIRNVASDPTLSYCNFKNSGGSDSWETDFGIDNGNNIDTAVAIVNSAEGDVRLFSNSLMINAGNITYGNNIGQYQGAGITPVITIQESLADFDTLYAGNSSGEEQFVVSGTELIEDVIVIAPAGFQITRDQS